MEKISIVVPCYNEEKNINNFYEEMIKTLEKVKENYSYEIIFVNDGSNDQTEIEVKKVRKTDKNVILISFSRNFGKEAAIYAGLNNATGDLVALIDADLQHPPVTILEMIKGINEGYDVVATKRKNRKGEPVIKSVFSKLFYKMMRMFIPIEKNVQDFRLMKKEVVDAILSLKEYNRFSKGIFTWVGFNIKYIEIEKNKVKEINEYINCYEKENNIQIKHITMKYVKGCKEKAFYKKITSTNCIAVYAEASYDGVINFYTGRKLKEIGITEELNQKYEEKTRQIGENIYCCVDDVLICLVYVV